MRRYLVGVAAVAAALSIPGAAAAKGPSSATITGPGLDHRLVVSGDGEMGPGSALGTLVSLGGFMAQMYGQTPRATLTAQPPGSTLGPRYRIVYVVPGPNAIRSRVVQLVYPYAKPVPLTYMSRGQTYWGTRKTLGGWFRSSSALTRALAQAGLPARR
jgi:hypothetical protein